MGAGWQVLILGMGLNVYWNRKENKTRVGKRENQKEENKWEERGGRNDEKKDGK